MEQERRRVGIYTRISADASGDALGVQRQEDDARKLCADRGWTVVDVFCDNDRSAYDRRKIRPAYQELLDAVKSRTIDTIVAWHPDRLHRQTRELVGFIDLINEHNVTVETVAAGVYDLSTPSGRMNARMLGSVAEYESEHRSERIRRKLIQNAADGRHHGGSRPYGWTDDRITLDPAEAAVVRKATAMILSGESVVGTARRLNADGATTATGKPWRDVVLRGMLLRPRNCGIRVHRGEEVGQGKWEPIITESDFRQVVAILKNPSRVTNPGKNGKVHLLSVIALCGVCGAHVFVARGKAYKGRQYPIYRCRRAHVIRDQARVDDLVTRLVLGRLAMPDAKDLLVEPVGADHAHAAAVELQQLEDRLTDAAEAFAAGAITLPQLTTITSAVRPRLEELQARSSSPSRAKVLDDLLMAEDPPTVWDAMTPERRRAVVDMLVEVRIHPTRRGAGFDPGAIEVTWK
ncbi:recombinase family protein [Mycolicibacterium sp. XJ2]